MLIQEYPPKIELGLQSCKNPARKDGLLIQQEYGFGGKSLDDGWLQWSKALTNVVDAGAQDVTAVEA